MSNATETKRRGRPENFPGQETVARLYHLPVETIEAVTAEAKRRGVPLGVLVDSLLSRSMREITRKRKK